jgi:hypothetical protein
MVKRKFLSYKLLILMVVRSIRGKDKPKPREKVKCILGVILKPNPAFIKRRGLKK